MLVPVTSISKVAVALVFGLPVFPAKSVLLTPVVVRSKVPAWNVSQSMRQVPPLVLESATIKSVKLSAESDLVGYIPLSLTAYSVIAPEATPLTTKTGSSDAELVGGLSSSFKV